MSLVYSGIGLGLDCGTRYLVCWVGRVLCVHSYYCTDLAIFMLIDLQQNSNIFYSLACVLFLLKCG